MTIEYKKSAYVREIQVLELAKKWLSESASNNVLLEIDVSTNDENLFKAENIIDDLTALCEDNNGPNREVMKKVRHMYELAKDCVVLAKKVHRLDHDFYARERGEKGVYFPENVKIEKRLNTTAVNLEGDAWPYLPDADLYKIRRAIDYQTLFFYVDKIGFELNLLLGERLDDQPWGKLHFNEGEGNLNFGNLYDEAKQKGLVEAHYNRATEVRREEVLRDEFHDWLRKARDYDIFDQNAGRGEYKKYLTITVLKEFLASKGERKIEQQDVGTEVPVVQDTALTAVLEVLKNEISTLKESFITKPEISEAKRLYDIETATIRTAEMPEAQNIQSSHNLLSPIVLVTENDKFIDPGTEDADWINSPNKFNIHVKIKSVYDHFKKHLVDKRYLSEENLIEYIKSAFIEGSGTPKTKFLLTDFHKGRVKGAFYEFYCLVLGKSTEASKCVSLLSEWFAGFNFNEVYRNWSSDYNTYIKKDNKK